MSPDYGSQVDTCGQLAKGVSLFFSQVGQRIETVKDGRWLFSWMSHLMSTSIIKDAQHLGSKAWMVGAAH